MDFTTKNVVITGGCGGIGKNFAIELLQRGVKAIGLFDIMDAHNTTNFLKTQFPDQFIKFYKTDVTNKSNIMESFKEFKENVKQIDVVIVGAGILNEFAIEKTIEINLIGAINTILIGMDYMSISNNESGGTIISISSTAGLEFSKYSPSYSATKHGLLAFTSSLANEINTEKHGIRFITICPGTTDTELLDEASFQRRFLPEFVPTLVKHCKTNPSQKPEVLAKLTMETLKEGKNGSIWIISNNQIKEHIPQKIDRMYN